MREASGFVGKVVLNHEEFGSLQATLYVVNIRLSVGQVLAEAVKSFDLALENSFEHGRHHEAGLVRQCLYTPTRP